MKVVKLENSSLKEVNSGVYKINFPNGKSYIGISNNMYRRMLEHNTDFRNRLPIEFAIQKYGSITEYEILEIIDPKNRKLMREREQYWIKYYKTNQKEYGYNISPGGDGASSGSENHEAKFTEEEILVLYEELKENKIKLSDLAKKYNVSVSTISHINNGKTYYHSSIKYPVRSSKECKKVISGTNSPNSYIDEKLIEQIYESLINEQNVSMAQLSKKYGISKTIIQNINKGKTYFNKQLHYPLREPKTGARKLSQEQIEIIIKKISEETNKSLAQIGRDLGINPKTISSINTGFIYKQPNINYPIRKKH